MSLFALAAGRGKAHRTCSARSPARGAPGNRAAFAVAASMVHSEIEEGLDKEEPSLSATTDKTEFRGTLVQRTSMPQSETPCIFQDTLDNSQKYLPLDAPDKLITKKGPTPKVGSFDFYTSNFNLYFF